MTSTSWMWQEDELMMTSGLSPSPLLQPQALASTSARRKTLVTFKYFPTVLRGRKKSCLPKSSLQKWLMYDLHWKKVMNFLDLKNYLKNYLLQSQWQKSWTRPIDWRPSQGHSGDLKRVRTQRQSLDFASQRFGCLETNQFFLFYDFQNFSVTKLSVFILPSRWL